MTYPGGSTYPKTEWLINGTWTDVSSRVRGDITINARGRASEQGSASPTQASCTMDNVDDALSNRNPNSAWYRLIPNGTQVRHFTGTGDNHLYMPYRNVDENVDLTSCRTADKAALDLTGDIEIRIDVRPHTWRPAARSIILASKYQQSGNQRSWLLYIEEDGTVSLAWSPDGTIAARVTARSTTQIPATSGRLAIKATLDVNNGAGGNTVAFYTATSISGTYTQLGTSVVTAGVTSVFSSTAAVIVGGGDDIGQVFTDGIAFGGRAYGFHLYNGIGGSRVANPDFTAWSVGDTSKVDSHSNTWTAQGLARITSPRLRFWGELVSVGLDTDRTSTDNTVDVQAADLTQRLGNARQKVTAPLSLNIKDRAGLLGWWPFDDGESATSAAAGRYPGDAATTSGGVEFGTTSDLAGASSVATLATSTSKVRFKSPRGTNTGFWQAIILFKVPALPAAESSIFTFNTSGTARQVVFSIGAASFRISLFDAAGVSLGTSSSGFGTGVVVADNWIAMRIQLTQNGANQDWAMAWYQQGSGTFWGISGSIVGTAVGYISSGLIQTSMASEFTGTEICHLAIAEQSMGFASGDTSWSSAIDAYAGETAAARIERVCTDAGLYVEVVGEAGASALLGAQPIDTILNVLEDATKADGGLLYGLRDAYGVGYRTRQDLERHLDVNVTYGQLSEVPKVFDDGQNVVNDVTIERTGGSSARAQITSGPNSIADPPNGVGVKDGGDTLNLYADDVLPDVANLRARVSSFDAARIPNLAVGYHRSVTAPTSTPGGEAMHADLGATIGVTGWPSHLPPDQVLFLVQGYQETFGTFLWAQTFNVTPAGPYQTGMYDTATQIAGPTRYGATSTLSTGINTSTTTIVVAAGTAVTTSLVWTSTSARYPLNVVIDGEEITLNTPPGGSTSPQTFTGVTRSVNGVVKSHLAGAVVDLYAPTYYGL